MNAVISFLQASRPASEALPASAVPQAWRPVVAAAGDARPVAVAAPDAVPLPEAAVVAPDAIAAAVAAAGSEARSVARAWPAAAARPDVQSAHRLPADAHAVRAARPAASAAGPPLEAAVAQQRVAAAAVAMTAPDLVRDLASVAARQEAAVTAHAAEWPAPVAAAKAAVPLPAERLARRAAGACRDGRVRPCRAPAASAPKQPAR
jgi:fused signal recognition particle receptor